MVSSQKDQNKKRIKGVRPATGSKAIGCSPCRTMDTESRIRFKTVSDLFRKEKKKSCAMKCGDSQIVLRSHRMDSFYSFYF
ncbi:hypothetical protein EFP84_06590 [Leptospira kmetyi]|uniref:Uncharacterized protein n=1 Tax=Leptospira kmetyi TaxID=408139 RepID=A0AAD0XPX5_9LEPT|nr:hypothetical protein EFP84_06590 [Leptospira kmetyi]